MLVNFGDAFAGEEHQAFTWHAGRFGALLIHGFPGTPAEMNSVARILHEAGWTVHAPLLPGFGQEIDSLPDKRAEDWSRSVKQALQDLRANCDKVIIVGLSMGGALAMQLSAEEDELDGLVLLAPFWQINHVLWKSLPVLRYVLPKFKPFKLFKPDFNDPETRAGILNFMPDIDLNQQDVRQSIMNFEIPIVMIDQVRKIGKQGHDSAHRIRTKALIIQGTQDELVRPHITRKLIKQFTGQVQYIEVDGGHDLTNDGSDHWQDIERALLHFTESIKSRET